jgi:hypothetical protein
MKTRNGFVSNSSTTSFSAVGVVFKGLSDLERKQMIARLIQEDGLEIPDPASEDENDQDWWGWEYRDVLEMDGYYAAENTDDGLEEGEFFLGVLLARWNDDGNETTRTNLRDVIKVLDRMRNKLNLPEVTHPTIVLTGTKCS